MISGLLYLLKWAVQLSPTVSLTLDKVLLRWDSRVSAIVIPGYDSSLPYSYCLEYSLYERYEVLIVYLLS